VPGGCRVLWAAAMGRMGQFLAVAVFGAVSQTAGALTLELQLVTGNVTNPVHVTHAGDDSGRLFIVEQAGRVKIFNGTTLLSPPFLDISGLVASSGEQGLLSVAFDPGYKTNGHFYVYYTHSSGNSNIVARFTAVPPTANTVSAATRVEVISITHTNQANHNGGQIQFGPDGCLYIATGDGGGSCDNVGPNNAQNLNSLLGKLLRLDVRTNQGYRIPPGNPFVGVAGLDEIWAYGLRNPWRFSFDRVSGELFVGDVGQGAREEINFQPATSTGGENYGWRCIEGTVTNTCGVACAAPGMVPPIIEYSRNPSRAVIGGYRYRGWRIRPLYGSYVFADYFNPAPIWAATNTSAGVWHTNLLLTAPFNISGFGEDEAGELYVCRHSSTAGQIYRIVWRDSDGDGMADDWEQQYFGSATAASPSEDADGDGFTNLQEFVAWTDPTRSASALRITAIDRAGADIVVSFTAEPGRRYRLERNTELGGGGWTFVAETNATSAGVVQLSDPGAAGLPKRNYRAVLLSP
jgi:glucose/arabinose dehydrogenase